MSGARQSARSFGDGFIGIGSIIVVTLAIFSLTLAFFFPVYTDEIVWKLGGRLTYDGLQQTKTLPSCGTFSFAIQPLLLPFHLLDTVIYQDMVGPLPIRIIGVALALCWGTTAWLLLRRLLRTQIEPRTIATALVGFSTLGVMPFLLVVNRPEQIMLIAITALLIALLADPVPQRRRPIVDLAYAAALALGCGYVLAVHPRALFAFPLMLLFIVRFFAGWFPRLLTGVTVVCFATAALSFWSEMTRCSNPALQELFIRDNILFAIQSGKLSYYAHLLWWDFNRDPLDFAYSFLYLKQFQLGSSHTWDIIPGAPASVGIPVSVITTLFCSLFLVAGALAFLLLLLDYVRSRRGLVPFLALGSLWVFYAFSSVARISKFDYEASLMEPLIVLVSFGSVWAARGQISKLLQPSTQMYVLRSGFGALIGLSLANQIVLLLVYTPFALGAWTDPGYALGQKHSVVAFGYDGIRANVLKTASLCGIDPATHPSHLVVDELTYFALEPVYQPVFFHYIDENGWGRGIPEIKQFLTKWHSAGFVMNCATVPGQLRSETIQNGQLCCHGSF